MPAASVCLLVGKASRSLVVSSADSAPTAICSPMGQSASASTLLQIAVVFQFIVDLLPKNKDRILPLTRCLFPARGRSHVALQLVVATCLPLGIERRLDAIRKVLGLAFAPKVREVESGL